MRNKEISFVAWGFVNCNGYLGKVNSEYINKYEKLQIKMHFLLENMSYFILAFCYKILQNVFSNREYASPLWLDFDYWLIKNYWLFDCGLNGITKRLVRLYF